MPELPEVQTTVAGLQKILPRLVIKDVWTDLAKKNQRIPHFKETLKDLSFYQKFRREVSGKKVISVERRAKNILINISGGKTILIHMKMTGHIMVGKYSYDKKTNSWTPAPDEKNLALRDPFNRFIHTVFTLTSPRTTSRPSPYKGEEEFHLVFCDSRKFGTVKLVARSLLYAPGSMLHALGPEPLDKNFTFAKFTERLSKKLNGKIKPVLLDQSIISGIGNIYSDEMLWLAGINPRALVKDIPAVKMKKLYAGMKSVLAKGIDFGGDSTSDYRDVQGVPGKFSYHHKAYRMTGKRCSKPRCTGGILRIIIGARSAHYCSVHQRLSNK